MHKEYSLKMLPQEIIDSVEFTVSRENIFEDMMKIYSNTHILFNNNEEVGDDVTQNYCEGDN